MSAVRRPGPGARARRPAAPPVALLVALPVVVALLGGSAATRVDTASSSPAGTTTATSNSTSGTTTSGTATTATTAPDPAGPPTRAAVQDRVVPVDTGAVLAAVDAAAAGARGSVALAVVGPGGEDVVAGPAAGEAVPTASLVKLLVVGRLLQLGAEGAVTLTGTDLGRMERAVVRSDDTAMSLLWDRFGGAALVTDAAAAAGLSATAPPAEAGQWGEATTSAADVARLLAGLETTFGAGPAQTLLGWMRATSATAADGFSQAFGLLAGTSGVAAKQGWMCCVRGTRQLHSAGVLADGTVVVLLGDFPASTSWGRARTALDTAAAAVLAALA
ncbi:serine hydrolase [Geodermatophilus sp. SYSU D01106]